MSAKSLFTQVVAVMSLWVGAGPLAHTAPKSATHTIIIEGMKFVPENLEVKAGDTIEWVNKDFVPHTATSEKKAFDSGEIKANQKWKFVAKSKGEFPYVCKFHPTMNGSLTVK